MQEKDTQNQNESSTSEVYTVIRGTWLSRAPNGNAFLVAMASWVVLALSCLLYWRDALGAQTWMPASRALVFSGGEYWRLWTTTLAHADLGHLAANSLMFFIFGYFLYGYFGARLFPWLALFMGGVINAFSLVTYAADIRLVGASGVVSWMGGAWLGLYFLINTQASLTQRSLRSFGVFLMLFAPAETFDPKISYRTHMIGFLVGVACGGAYYFWKRREFKAAEVVEIRVDD